MQSDKRILFICHESSRTGAPVFLLSFIKWIKENSSIYFQIIIDKGGELEDEYKKLGPTTILRPQQRSLIHKIWIKIALRTYLKYKIRTIRDFEFDIVYSNTIINGMLSSIIRENFHCKIITHVHELETVIRSTGRNNIRSVKNNTFHYIAASNAVKQNLIQNHAIPEEKITVHYECIDESRFLNPEVEPDIHDYKISESDFIVGGAGFVDYRKGFDLFLQTAEWVCIKKGYINIKFMWIGTYGRGKERMVSDYIKEKNLGENVYFLGEKKNPLSFFELYDVFYLSSREDPFPMVMLENACLGKPVIGFKDSGGFEEFIGNNPEYLIEEFNIFQAGDLIIKMSKSKNELHQIGKTLKQKVEDHYTFQKKGGLYLQNILDWI